MQLGELLSLFLGVLNIILWLFIFIPQLYLNYTKKSTDALSILLFVIVLCGGTLSLISAIIKGVAMPIIYLGIYHLFLNIVFITQLVYYRIYWTKKNFTKLELIISSTLLFITFITIILLIIFDFPLISAEIIAWVSCVLFSFSKIPQIILNHSRKTLVGLSLPTFIMLIVANLLLLSSIFVNLIDDFDIGKILLVNLQWIISSFFSLFFDFVLIYQFYLYGNTYQHIDDQDIQSIEYNP